MVVKVRNTMLSLSKRPNKIGNLWIDPIIVGYKTNEIVNFLFVDGKTDFEIEFFEQYFSSKLGRS
jgi:hypothetical protein